MKHNKLSQSLAILLTAAISGTSFADLGAAGVATSTAMPDFVKSLVPPTNLGSLVSYYKGTTEKPVVLIQDLHANYGVQKKLVGMLKHLQPIVAQGGRKMTLGIEGAWGELDFSKIRATEEKVLGKAANFLLKEVEISGMEYFAATTPTPIRFVGIENPQDYTVHRTLFQKSLGARLHLSQKLDTLRGAVADSKAEAPSALRKIWRLEDKYKEGKIDLPELSKALGVEINDYGHAEEALANAKAAVVKASKPEKTRFLENVILADKDLDLLARLFRQQLTLEEVQHVGKRIPEMLMVVRALIPGEDMTLWKDTIQSAIDHYAVALLRDKPMAERAVELAQQNPESSVVIVTGGFHTAGISNEMKSRGISYVVLAPMVESHTTRDEQLYMQRMMDIHVTRAQMAKGIPTTPSSFLVPATGAMVSKVMPPNTTSERSQAVFPAAIDVSRTQRAMAEATAEASLSAQDSATVGAIEAATTAAAAVKTGDGLFRRITNRLKKLVGKTDGPEIVVDATPTKAVDVPVAAPAKATQAGFAIPKAVQLGGLFLVMSAVGFSQTAQNAANTPQGKAIQEAAASGDSSALVNALLIVGGTALAGYIGKKYGKTILTNTRKALVYGYQA